MALPHRVRQTFCALASATAAVVCLGAGPAHASASRGSDAATGAAAYRFHRFTTTLGGKLCRRIGLHSINDHGAILGAGHCGRDTAFVRGPGQHFNFTFGHHGRPEPTSISDTGAIVGQTENARTGSQHAWLRAPDGTLTALSDPHADGSSTAAIGINARSTVVGYYYSRRGDHARSFEYYPRTATYVPLRVPARVHATKVVALDIDDRGDTCGYYTVAGGTEHGFVIVHGAFHRIDAPHAPRGASRGTWITSIGGPNLYAGVTRRGYSTVHPYQAGFVDRDGKFTRITVPPGWGSNTFILGMNIHGRVVGDYYTKSGQQRAFTANT